MIRRSSFRVISFLFLTILSFSLWNNDLRGKEVSYRGSIPFYRESDPKEPVPIGESDQAACRFRTMIPISGVTIIAPSYANNIGTLRISLFVWAGSYDETLRNDPIASETFVDFQDNQALTLSVGDALEPGEYLWLVDGAREKVGLWRSKESSVPDVTCFMNGTPIESKIWQYSLNFPAAFPFSGGLADYKRLLKAKSTAPKEPSISDKDPITVWDVQADTWDAVDELGRSLPDQSEAGPVRSDKQVGIFYWTWHNSERINGGCYDVTKILTEHPEAVNDINHPAWGPLTAPHHWGEPLFGYYVTCDPWILRRHAEMLADAGIDAAIFDATNGTLTWMDSVLPLLETWGKARQDGVRTPKVAFMLPFFNKGYVAISLRQIYRDIYQKGLHPELWYYWEGKPLVYATPDAIDDLIASTTDKEELEELREIREFFTFRPGQPAYAGGPRRPDEWGWLEVYPQNGYVQRNDGSFEMVTVGVAQNWSENPIDGKPGLHAMNDRDVFGRGHVVGKKSSAKPDDFIAGGNFEQQWGRAFELDPSFVFVTGWNEWVAGRHGEWQGLPNAFPDQYNEEFSRDCEPERGKLMDTFYLQLVANVRKFKGVRKQPVAGAPTTIDLDGKWSQWNDVAPEYRDYLGDTLHRDFDGYGKIHYVNDSGRNDIIRAKVARDEENLYFYVETAEELSKFEGSNWMRLFLAFPKRANEPNWKGFSFLVEQTKEKAVLKKAVGKTKDDWAWEEVAELPRRAGGKRLAVSIPRSLLNLAGKKVDLQFKWSDNTRVDGDILDFYQYGDTAPDGRFVYRYKEK